ncbi:MAG: hypothetical protein QXD03_04470 [Candidatus Anstonellales archaeon]
MSKLYSLVGCVDDNTVFVFNLQNGNILKLSLIDNYTNILGIDTENKTFIQREGVSYPILNHEGKLIRQEDLYKIVLLGVLDDKYVVFISGNISIMSKYNLINLIKHGYSAVNFYVRSTYKDDILCLLRGNIEDYICKTRPNTLDSCNGLKVVNDNNNTTIYILKSYDVLEIPINSVFNWVNIKVYDGVVINKLIINSVNINYIHLESGFIKKELVLNVPGDCTIYTKSLKDIPIITSKNKINLVLHDIGTSSKLIADKEVLNRIHGFNDVTLNIKNNYEEVIVDSTGIKHIKDIYIRNIDDDIAYIYKFILKGSCQINLYFRDLLCKLIDVRGLDGNISSFKYVMTSIVRFSLNNAVNNMLKDIINKRYLDIVIVSRNDISHTVLCKLHDIDLVVSHRKLDVGNNIVISEVEEDKFISKFLVDMDKVNSIINKAKLIGVDIPKEYDLYVYKEGIQKLIEYNRCKNFKDELKLNKTSYVGDVLYTDDIDNSTDEKAIRFKLINNTIVKLFPQCLEYGNFRGINKVELVRFKGLSDYSIIAYNYGEYSILKILINNDVKYTTIVNNKLLRVLLNFNVTGVLKTIRNKLYANGIVYKIDGVYVDDMLGSKLSTILYNNCLLFNYGGNKYIYDINTGLVFSNINNEYKICDINHVVECINDVIDRGKAELDCIDMNVVLNREEESELLKLKKKVDGGLSLQVLILEMLYSWYSCVSSNYLIDRKGTVGDLLNTYVIGDKFKVLEYRYKTSYNDWSFKFNYVMNVVDLKVNSVVANIYSRDSIEDIYRALLKLDIGNGGIDLQVDGKEYDYDDIRDNLISINHVVVGNKSYGYIDRNVGMFINKLDGRGYLMELKYDYVLDKVKCKLIARFNSINGMVKLFNTLEDFNISDFDELYDIIRGGYVNIYNNDYKALIKYCDIIGD